MAYLRRKLPAILSLIIGVLVGLLFAQSFGKSVSRIFDTGLQAMIRLVIYLSYSVTHHRTRLASNGKALAGRACNGQQQAAIDLEDAIQTMYQRWSSAFACLRTLVLSLDIIHVK